MLDTSYIIIVILFGLAFGSFLNVVIVRLPEGQSIISPPSQCPQCRTRLNWWQNIPVLSYLLLRGKCHNCQEKISIIYPLVETVTSLLLCLLWISFPYTWEFGYYAIFTLMLVVIAAIDIRHFLIFDIISLPGIVLGITLPLVFPLHNHTFIQALIGTGAGAGMLFLIRLLGNRAFKKDTMGIGDIKLAGLIGAFLGWELILLSIFLAALLLTMVAAIKLVLKKYVAHQEYPFGFYLAIAAIVEIFFGDAIIEAYLNFVLT